jgi:hypothetical protein
MNSAESSVPGAVGAGQCKKTVPSSAMTTTSSRASLEPVVLPHSYETKRMPT